MRKSSARTFTLSCKKVNKVGKQINAIILKIESWTIEATCSFTMTHSSCLNSHIIMGAYHFSGRRITCVFKKILHSIFLDFTTDERQTEFKDYSYIKQEQISCGYQYTSLMNHIQVLLK